MLICTYLSPALANDNLVYTIGYKGSFAYHEYLYADIIYTQI